MDVKQAAIRTDFARKRISSSTRSRSGRAVASDRGGEYMLKKCSGTRNEKACASIADNAVRFSRAVSCALQRTDRTHPKS
jgi:hypothetical protein